MTEQQFTLHLIFSVDGWNLASSLIESHDRVLFLQDAVYLINSLNNPASSYLYARALDVDARNLTLNPHIEDIDDEQWLSLTESAHNVISW